MAVLAVPLSASRSQVNVELPLDSTDAVEQNKLGTSSGGNILRVFTRGYPFYDIK
jgi:hypothetical protein